MRRTTRFVGFLALLSCALAGVGFDVLADLKLDLSIDPAPVARGGMLTITAIAANSGAAPIEGATLYLPLPVGFDQWKSESRIDGGAWTAYPANGLIPLDPIPAASDRTIEIRTWVEHAAPASLGMVAQILDAVGMLAEAGGWVNVLPTVDAGADLLVDMEMPVSLLDASVGDGGGGIASYAWSDGGSGGAFDDPGLLHPTYTPIQQSGLIELTLIATDLDGDSSGDSLRLRVNSPPDVDAGPDQTGDEGTAIELAGATASDPDGWIVGYAWSDGGAGGTFEPSSTVLDPTYTLPQLDGVESADVELTLTATDDWGATGDDSLTVTVRNVNAPPQVDAGDDRAVGEGNAIDLSGASATDPDGSIVALVWSDGGAGGTFDPPADVLAPSYRAPRLDGCADMEIELRLTATDDLGATGSDTLILTVGNENGSPTVDAGEDREADAGDLVMLDAAVADEDGGSPDVRWEQTSGLVVSIESVAEAIRFVAPDVVTSERLEFTVFVTDACGAMAFDSVRVTVHPGLTDTLPASLDVRIEASDVRGFPLLPLDVVSAGEPITFEIVVTNTGEVPIADLSAFTSEGLSLELSVDRLDPWERAVATLVQSAEPSESDDRFELTVDVDGRDTAGESVQASGTFALQLRTSEDEVGLHLRMMSDRDTVSIGETIRYSYTIRNSGTIPVVGLALHDERIGQVPLPVTEIDAGEALHVVSTTIVDASDLPGPLRNTSIVSGFTRQGAPVEAEAEASVEIEPDVAGGGGTAREGDPAFGRLVISEIAWAGTRGNPEAEWIELANTCSGEIDLTGWRLCWYETGDGVPDESEWTRIDLIGRVAPMIVASNGLSDLSFVETEDGAWRVIDPRWGDEGTRPAGYFLLERGDDDTVSDVLADQIYDRSLELPDRGAAIFLIDPDGRIVDSANAQSPARPGWAAGSADSWATMERIRLDLGDAPSNWQTHPGLLMSGLDGRGRPLLATAARPNCPAIDALLQLAASRVTPVPVQGAMTTALPIAGVNSSPLIQLSLSGGIAGGGGSIGALPAISSRRDGSGAWLDVDLTGAASGTYFIWISYPDGGTYLLVLAK